MAEPYEDAPTDVTAQVRRHLESLRAAGVEWLPTSGPPIVLTRSPVVGNKEAPEDNIETAILPMASPVEDRRQELDVLAKVVSGCTRCKELAATRTQTVFGVGRIDPDICFIGEAPGREEDATGEPFVGPAGQLLTRIIAAMGMKREEVYICNILRCRPPGNRQPQPDEAAHCREYLERTLELVRPKYICALGASAAKYLLGTSQGITKMRGNFYDFRGIPVMCTFHPSYLLRDPTKKKEVWDDMRALLTRLGKPVPGR
jgi:uracil-DNA glycosylase